MDRRRQRPTKEALARAEAALKQATADQAKVKSFRDLQDAEILAREENTQRLKAMRLAKEATDAEAANKK